MASEESQDPEEITTGSTPEEALVASILDIPEEELQKLPAKERQEIKNSLSITMSGSNPQLSPLERELKPEHITQIIQNVEAESQREFEKTKLNENTKRWGMGAILSLVIIVLLYAGITKDKELSEKVILAGISAIGGFSAGYALAKDS